MADFFDAVADAPEVAALLNSKSGSNSTARGYGTLPPSVARFWSACTGDAHGQPAEFITLWVLGGLCLVAGCSISARHLRALGRMPFSTRRSLSIGICRQPPVFAVASFLGILLPRGSFLWLELMHVYEARTHPRVPTLLLPPSCTHPHVPTSRTHPLVPTLSYPFFCVSRRSRSSTSAS